MTMIFLMISAHIVVTFFFLLSRSQERQQINYGRNHKVPPHMNVKLSLLSKILETLLRHPHKIRLLDK